MATIEGLEKKIKAVEGFDVKLMHRDGRDVRGEKKGVALYQFTRRAPDKLTVERFRRLPIEKKFDRYLCAVLLGNGTEAQGNMKLDSVRATY